MGSMHHIDDICQEHGSKMVLLQHTMKLPHRMLSIYKLISRKYVN
jgi:hypothetical protein